jgi:hypothetical protein
MKFLLLITIITFWGCQSGQNKVSVNSDTDSLHTVKNDTIRQTKVENSDLSGYIQSEEINLNGSSKLPLGLTTLKGFEQNGNVRAKKINDSLFAEFLKSFTTYQNQSNDLLYDHPKYETYNTLAYSRDDIIAPEALTFQDSIKQLGFIIGMTEGSIFLKKDPEFLDRFSPYLSERMNLFKAQYNLENEQPLAEDGGLIISTNEQIKRMLFWEKFGNKHPDFELPEYANNQFQMYLFYLMFGMDNTPIHDWSDSLNVRTELVNAYKSIIAEYPNSKATEFLIEYLKYIEQKGFKYDRSFNEYGREKFPSMHGN